MNIHTLHQLADREIIDYPWLMSALSEYKRPREKLSLWLKSGDLIRVKKGLYLFGSASQQTPYNPLTLANLVYGPSAVSLTYALSYYGLIPERVTDITSITAQRDKLFETPVGRFTYRYLHPKKYAIGIQWIQQQPNESYFIATPEKALCDHLTLTDKKINFNTLDNVENYLENDMRIDMNALHNFNIKLLREIMIQYHCNKLEKLYLFINRWKNK